VPKTTRPSARIPTHPSGPSTAPRIRGESFIVAQSTTRAARRSPVPQAEGHQQNKITPIQKRLARAQGAAASPPPATSDLAQRAGNSHSTPGVYPIVL
jgi:hypothetical protein